MKLDTVLATLIHFGGWEDGGQTQLVLLLPTPSQQGPGHHHRALGLLRLLNSC